jgi:hypothetical protein
MTWPSDDEILTRNDHGKLTSHFDAAFRVPRDGALQKASSSVKAVGP